MNSPLEAVEFPAVGTKPENWGAQPPFEVLHALLADAAPAKAASAAIQRRLSTTMTGLVFGFSPFPAIAGGLILGLGHMIFFLL